MKGEGGPRPEPDEESLRTANITPTSKLADLIQLMATLIKPENLETVINVTGAVNVHRKILRGLGAAVRTYERKDACRSMSVCDQREYINILDQVYEVGGNMAVSLLMDMVGPNLLVCAGFQKELFKSWWQTVRFEERSLDLINNNYNYNYKWGPMLIKARQETRYVCEWMIDFKGKLDRKISEWNKQCTEEGGLSSQVRAEAIEQAKNHIDDLNYMYPHIKGTPWVRNIYCYKFYQHLTRTGGIEAYVLCVMTVKPQWFQELSYNEEMFEAWWSNQQELKHILPKITEISRGIKFDL